MGKHRLAVQTWLSKYREGGVAAMLEIKKSPGGVRSIPQWGATFRGEDSPRKLASEDALARRLQDQHHGFKSYYADLKWGSFQTLAQLQTKIDQLLAELTPEVIASITGYSFILNALSALNSV